MREFGLPCPPQVCAVTCESTHGDHTVALPAFMGKDSEQGFLLWYLLVVKLSAELANTDVELTERGSNIAQHRMCLSAVVALQDRRVLPSFRLQGL